MRYWDLQHISQPSHKPTMPIARQSDVSKAVSVSAWRKGAYTPRAFVTFYGIDGTVLDHSVLPSPSPFFHVIS